MEYKGVFDYKNQLKSSIGRTEKLVYSKKSQIDDLEYEILALKEKMSNLLRAYPDPLSTLDFCKIYKDFNSETHKFNKEAKESKGWVAFIEKNFLFGKDFKPNLIGLSDYNFSESYWFEYQLGKKKIIISIPMFKTATPENYNKLQYELMEVESEHSYSVFFRTYFVEEFMSKIREFFGVKEDE